MENTHIKLLALPWPRASVPSCFFARGLAWITSGIRSYSLTIKAMCLPLIFYNAFLLPYIGFVPVWDSNQYVQCVMRPWISDGQGILNSLSCFGHPSGLYVAFLRLVQMPDPGNIFFINAANFCLGNFSVLAFFFIVRAIFPKASFFHASLMTLAYATHPVLLANTVNFTLDTGILFFFIYTFALLLHRQYSWVALVGLFFVFTKEVGAPLYLLLIGTYVFFHVMRCDEPLRTRFSELLRCLEMAIPLLFFALFWFYQTTIAHEPMTWGGFGMAQQLPSVLTNFDFSSRAFHMALADIFILNFLWVSSCVTACASSIILCRWAFRLQIRSDCDRRSIAMLVSCLVIATLLLTRVFLINNIRYLIVLYPLSLIVFFASCRYLVRRDSFRTLALFLALLINVFTAFRSDDPVSQKMYGTFVSGNQRLYTLQGPIPLAYGYGRDQMIYNFQFSSFALAQDLVYELIKPTPSTPLVIANAVGYGFSSDRIDHRTFRRTFSPDGMKPLYVSAESAMNIPHPFSSFYYITYGFLAPSNELASLSQLYDVSQEWQVATSATEAATVVKFVAKKTPQKVASL